MTVELFRELFVLRDDVYALQSANGIYTPVEEKITDDVIQAHLNGTHTIGLYQLDKDQIKWACLDIDLVKEVWSDDDFDLSEWEKPLKKQAEKAKAILDANGIPSYIEHSGHKGYHVWVFFSEPTKAAPIQKGMNRMFRSMKKMDEKIEWEIFPKQTEVHPDSYGNLVKGASGYHHKSGEYSRFIDSISLETVKFAKPYKFKDLSKFNAIRMGCGAINAAWEQAVEDNHATNELRVAVGSLYMNMDETELAKKYVIDEFFSHMSDFDRRKTEYHLDKLANKKNMDGEEEGYAPISCERLQSPQYSICPTTCDNIGDSKTPFAFYLREKGQGGQGGQGSSRDSSENPGAESGSSELDKYRKIGNNYFFEKGNGDLKQLTTFVMNIEDIYHIDDGIQEKTIFSGEIITDNFKKDFELDSDDFASDSSFKKFLYRMIPLNNLMVPSDLDNVRMAISAHSDASVKGVSKKFGWYYDDSRQGYDYPVKYVTPSTIIDKEGIHDNEEILVNLEGEGPAEHLDLYDISDDELNDVKEHIKEDFMHLLDWEVNLANFAHTFVPIIFPFISGSGNNNKYAYFLRGQTGAGKSAAIQFCQCFYGPFGNDDKVTWTSTANALSRIGYFFNDAIYNIDDFKDNNLGSTYQKEQKLNLLQNFTDGTTRERMTQNLEINKSYPIRGWVMTAAEDFVTGEASNVARTVVSEVYQTDKNTTAYDRCMNYRKLYPGFTARYIHKLLNTNEYLIQKTFKQYRDQFHDKIRGENNDIRIARNLAILVTSLKYVGEFLWPKKRAQEVLEHFVEFREEHLKTFIFATSDELASERFVNTLNELISTGDAAIQPSSSDNSISDPYADIVGYYANVRTEDEDGLYPHIIMGRAYELVQQNLRNSGGKLGHSKKSVISDLHKSGYILEPEEVPRKMNGTSVRVVRFDPDKFNPDTEPVLE